MNLLINEVSGNHEAAIFDACGGTEVFCDNTPNSESVTGLTPSAQYFIVVWSDAGNEGDHEICLELPPTPPVNDDCASAVNLIPGTSCVPVTGNVALATQSIPAITCNTFTGDANDDVWYSFVAAATSETIEVTGSVDFDAVVDLRDGCTGNNIACADATLEGGTEQIVATGLTVGNTYFVRVYHYYTAVPATTGFDICVYHLAGDECTTAVTANDGANAFTTVGTPAASDVTSCATGDVFDTWFTYTATCTGTLVISTCDDADFNTSLGVYDACGGTELACNDDAAGCSGSTSEVTLSAAVNDVLLIRVSGTGGTTGSGNVSITCYPAVLYSQASGDSGDPIWDRVPVGTPGAEAFSRYTSLVIQNGHVITQDLATVEANSFTVESGGSYDMNGANALELEGDLTVDGTFDPSSGIVRLNGSSLQNIAGAATVDVYDLELDNAAGALVLADSVHVYRTLDLLSGDFDANGNEVVLMSDASGTARLGPVDPSASYTGFLRQQRYIPAGVTNWRLLSSPVSPLQLYQWREDFYTAGFPGSHWPTFDQPVGSNILWPSIRTYDETNTGTALTDGLVGPTDISDQIQVGRGYAAWCGDNLFTTTAFIIDVFKNPTIANTPVSLPMSWTDTGTPLVDGWNLVGNPLASPIDLDALVLGADVDGTFWVFDPVSGNNYFRDTDLDVGSGPMATSSTIQSSQGFWAKANGAANSVTVDESAKTLDPNGGSPFGGMQLQNTPLLRLGLHSQLNQFSDEALLHFGVGGPGADAIDIVKFTFSHPEAPQLWSASQDGDVLALNAWGTVPGTAAIPVHVNTAVTGDHTLEVMQLTQPMEGYCLVLEDLETGILTEVVLGATYTFTLDASAPADPARFLLHVSQLPEGTLTASATEVLVGEAVTFGSGTQPGALVTWDFGDGTTSTEEAPVHAYTLPGSYPVTLTVGSAPCDLVLTEVIEVGISTGLEDLEGEAFSAWTEGDAIRLRWSFAGSGVHEVKLFDPRGREVKALRLSEASGQATLELGGHPDGVYVLRLLGADRVRTVRLPVVR